MRVPGSWPPASDTHNRQLRPWTAVVAALISRGWGSSARVRLAPYVHDRHRPDHGVFADRRRLHNPLTSAYALRGEFQGRRRPLCVRAGRGRGRRNARTDTDGEGRSGARIACRSDMPTVLRHRLPADLPIQAVGSLAPQVVEPTAERHPALTSAASPPPAASISSIICTGTMYSPICSARWRGQGRVVTFL